jgi:alkylation response protein AidB-like acyl-CoA dehydrogenase
MMSVTRAPHPKTRFVLSEEEQILKETARRFIADRMPTRLLRALREKESSVGFDPGAWAELVALGWTGIAISEAFGGSGLGVRALAAIIEEMGKTLAPVPLASTALVAATVISRYATSDAAARWLPNIAAGTVIAALAVDEGPQGSNALPDTRVSSAADGLRLTGIKRFVADGLAANLLLVSARHLDRVTLALVRADSPGVTVQPLTTIDDRGMADILFDDVPIDAVLADLEGRDSVEYALDCARIGLAAEMLGASSRALEMTLDYMRTRRQFGQPIGSFQALQHRAAKLFIELELTRSCVIAAVDSLHRHDGDMPLLASLAKASAAELMRTLSYETIQLHGGIGMTDAHDAGLYLKRGRVAALLYGDAAFHINRYAALKGY